MQTSHIKSRSEFRLVSLSRSGTALARLRSLVGPSAGVLPAFSAIMSKPELVPFSFHQTDLAHTHIKT